jgi:hypothetical protein
MIGLLPGVALVATPFCFHMVAGHILTRVIFGDLGRRDSDD